MEFLNIFYFVVINYLATFQSIHEPKTKARNVCRHLFKVFIAIYMFFDLHMALALAIYYNALPIYMDYSGQMFIQKLKKTDKYGN